MQQLNQIILEGKVTDVTEDNECITIEHDSREGPPVCAHIITKHINNINSMDLKGRIVRVVGRLACNNYDDYIIEADFIEEHP